MAWASVRGKTQAVTCPHCGAVTPHRLFKHGHDGYDYPVWSYRPLAIWIQCRDCGYRRAYEA